MWKTSQCISFLLVWYERFYGMWILPFLPKPSPPPLPQHMSAFLYQSTQIIWIIKSKWSCCQDYFLEPWRIFSWNVNVKSIFGEAVYSTKSSVECSSNWYIIIIIVGGVVWIWKDVWCLCCSLNRIPALRWHSTLSLVLLNNIIVIGVLTETFIITWIKHHLFNIYSILKMGNSCLKRMCNCTWWIWNELDIL